VTDYENQFKQSCDVCGSPFPEIMNFFALYPVAQARVLDLGCGQGRDALPIARKGHHVTGVDISPTGIAQMLDKAANEGLDVEGYVDDVVEFQPVGLFDIVLLDRVLHMMKEDSERLSVPCRASEATIAGGYVLVADTPKNMSMIRTHFAISDDAWIVALDKKGFLFAQKRPAT